MLVEPEPDQAQVSGLLLAHEVTGAAQVEVPGRDRHAGPEPIERRDPLKPLRRRLAQGLAGSGHQIADALQATPPDPTAQLVELRHAEEFRVAHDHRVGARHVEPALDDAGGDQHVASAFGEGHEGGIDLLGCHPAMGRQDRQFRERLGERGCQGFEGRDPRHDDEALAIARFLAQQGRAEGRDVVGRHQGSDRSTAGRGRRHDAEVLQPDKRRLQGARNGRCRQGQDVDPLAEVAQPRLLGRAEPLLLVDDHEPEIRERDALGRDRMGADHDAKAAVGEAGPDAIGLGRWGQAGQVADRDAEFGEAPREGLHVLAHQNGRGCHEGHLPSGQHRHGGGPQRHLGLAEPDVADHQPIHRPPRREIVDHGRDRLGLIRGRREAKAGREGLVRPGRRLERRRRGLGAGAGQCDERSRGLGDLACDPLASLRPGVAVEPVEPDGVAGGAVAPQAVERFDGRQEIGLLGVIEPHRVPRPRPVGLQGFERPQHAHAMLDVDHRVAERELSISAMPWHRDGVVMVMVGTLGATAQKVRRRDHDDPGVGVDEAVFRRERQCRHGAGSGGFDLCPACDFDGRPSRRRHRSPSPARRGRGRDSRQHDPVARCDLCRDEIREAIDAAVGRCRSEA